jgi:hypothetical protein
MNEKPRQVHKPDLRMVCNSLTFTGIFSCGDSKVAVCSYFTPYRAEAPFLLMCTARVRVEKHPFAFDII